MLIPARTCTKAFHSYIAGVCEIRFIKGGVKLIHPVLGQGKAAPMPTMLVIWHHNDKSLHGKSSREYSGVEII